jgi:hypothetical protein
MNCKIKHDNEFLYSSFGKTVVISKISPIIIKNIYDEQMMLVRLEEPLIKYYKEVQEIEKLSIDLGDSYIWDAQIDRLRDVVETERAVLAPQMYNCMGCEQGVVTTNDPKCGRCETIMCLDCMNIKHQSHECNKADVESARLILTTSRKCPKCLTAISKIEGCNQMFCVLCQTPFSYISGKIIKREFFDNPHYINYIDNNPGVNIFDNVEEDDEEYVTPQPLQYPSLDISESDEKVLTSIIDEYNRLNTTINDQLMYEIDFFNDYVRHRFDYSIGIINNIQFMEAIVANYRCLEQSIFLYNFNNTTLVHLLEIISDVSKSNLEINDGLLLLRTFINTFAIDEYNNICIQRGYDNIDKVYSWSLKV